MLTPTHIFTFLDSDGEINANGDYSSGRDFVFEAPKRCRIERLLVNIVATGSMDSGNYGSGTNLNNGVRLIHEIRGVEYELTDLPIKTNADWGAYCYDIALSNFGSGDERLGIRWSFFKAGRSLRFRRGDKLIIRLMDDFTALNGHYFHIQGRF